MGSQTSSSTVQSRRDFLLIQQLAKITNADPSGIFKRCASSRAETSGFSGNTLSRVYALCVGYITDAWVASHKQLPKLFLAVIIQIHWLSNLQYTVAVIRLTL